MVTHLQGQLSSVLCLSPQAGCSGSTILCGSLPQVLMRKGRFARRHLADGEDLVLQESSCRPSANAGDPQFVVNRPRHRICQVSFPEQTMSLRRTALRRQKPHAGTFAGDTELGLPGDVSHDFRPRFRRDLCSLSLSAVRERVGNSYPTRGDCWPGFRVQVWRRRSGPSDGYPVEQGRVQ